MKRKVFIRMSLLVPLAPVLFTVGPAAAMSGITSEKFVATAGVAGKFEIDSSQIVAQKTQRSDLKSFAEQMIKDHTAAAEELKTTVGTKYTVPDKLDQKHQKMIDELEKGGSSQDASYVKMQLKAHKEAVELFDSYSKHGDDAALKQFAAKTLPTLKEHYAMIKKISAAKS
jgi:putative membrane protein